MNTILKHSPGQVQDVIQNIKKEKMIPKPGTIKIMVLKHGFCDLDFETFYRDELS
jgi:hypothetical protein